MGELASLSASGVWAAASLMFARLGKTVSALALNWLKCVIALVLMVIVLLILEGTVWPDSLNLSQTVILAISGLVGLTVGDTAFFHALNRLGPRRTLLISALSPPMTAVMAVPVLGEPLGFSMLLGMTLTMGGVIWVILERHPNKDRETESGATPTAVTATATATTGDEKQPKRFSRQLKIGVLFGLGYAFCQALGNVLTKLGGGHITALEISVVRLFFGILGLTLILGATRRLMTVAIPLKDRRTAWLVIAATFFGTFLGIWLMNAGLRYTYTGIASTLASTSPIFVLPLAYFFDGEKLTLRSVAGAFIAVSGVAVLFLI